MFSFDQAQLPKIQSRKAFIGVDFQKDFTDESGALAATEPQGYVGRAAELAEAFRSHGHTVIWARSEPGSSPAPGDEQIMASDFAPPATSRIRRRTPDIEALLGGPPDAEAFLSHDEPVCLKPDTDGIEMSAEIKAATKTSDLVLTKGGYSAFKNTQLLRVLRSKMVMEVFICGSLANIGVYATAIDAAGHGMAITIVDDCCGHRSEARRTIAFSRLSDLTGCEMESAETVREAFQPSSKQKRELGSRGRSGKPKSDSAKLINEAKETSDLTEDLSKLRLESNDPEPTSPKPKPKQPSDALANAAHPQGSTSSTVESPPSTNMANSVGNNKQPVDDANQVSPSKPRPAAEVDVPPPTETIKEVESSASAAGQAESKSPHDAPDTNGEAQRGLCAGDTDVIDALSADLEKGAFERLEKEVRWQRMSHQGGEVPRLVAVQGEVGEDGSIPIYRHPSDESPPLLPFTPTVLAIKAATEKHLGHPLNHVLIQYYRDGTDYISEHSDKTIDVVQGSYIANVSLGAQRTMVFRTKRQPKESPRVTSVMENVAAESDKQASEKETSGSAPKGSLPPLEVDDKQASPRATESTQDETKIDKSTTNGESKRQVQRATLRHNSLCRMGLQTNMEWLHSIRQDKRADRDKSPAELAFGGKRISLTFRRIGTFLSSDERKIWGQGATGKNVDDAHAVINGESTEMVEMLKAFGKENHSSSFDWDSHYGKGFDVLHMSNAPRFFASRDALVNMRIALMLAAYGIGYAKGSMTASKTCNLDDDQLEAASVKFVDSDATKSAVQGDMAIMMYLHSCYGPDKDERSTSKPDMAKQLTRFQKALTFLTRWRRVQKAPSRAGGKPDLKDLKEELFAWESFAPVPESDDGFMEGKTLGLVDFALWPVLHDILQVCGKDALDVYPSLKDYMTKFAETDAAKAVVPSVKDLQVETTDGATDDAPKRKE
ncbi:isochorismatase family protein [Sarocladium implicatum]|nr:isochorismatase family protein [Sarocladium implicatum]